MLLLHDHDLVVTKASAGTGTGSGGTGLRCLGVIIYSCYKVCHCVVYNFNNLGGLAPVDPPLGTGKTGNGKRGNGK